MNAESTNLVKLNELQAIAGKVDIQFRLTLKPGEGLNSQGHTIPTRDAHIEVWLNGQKFDLEVDWDLLAIVASGRGPGGYYLGNCDCGNPDCAGIWKPILVRHDGDEIRWEIPNPYVHKKSDLPPGSIITISFDIVHYQEQAAALFLAFKRVVSDGGLVVRTPCYIGELPIDLIAMAESGCAGHGGRGPIWQTTRLF